MKRSVLLIVALALSLGLLFALSSCGEEEAKDCVHTDENADHLCEKCIEMISDHVDEDRDHKCDTCDLTYTAECDDHTDTDRDKKCDYCEAAYIGECKEHTDFDRDKRCDYCNIVHLDDCLDHIDADKDHLCDYCRTKCTVSCTDHINEDSDDKCDYCEACTSHDDKNGDYRCDACREPYYDNNCRMLIKEKDYSTDLYTEIRDDLAIVSFSGIAKVLGASVSYSDNGIVTIKKGEVVRTINCNVEGMDRLFAYFDGELLSNYDTFNLILSRVMDAYICVDFDKKLVEVVDDPVPFKDERDPYDYVNASLYVNGKRIEDCYVRIDGFRNQAELPVLAIFRELGFTVDDREDHHFITNDYHLYLIEPTDVGLVTNAVFEYIGGEYVLDDKTFAEKFNDLIFDVEIDEEKSEVRISYTPRFY